MNNFLQNFLKKENSFSTSTVHFTPNNNKDATENYIRQAPLIFPRPNDDIEFIVPLFDARKHYKHLKKMMWKHQRR